MRTPSRSESPLSPEQLILPPWRTNCHVTRLLISNIPPKIWAEHIPGMPRRTVRMVQVAHEAHHRGQLLLAARQLGAPPPREVTDGLWWWQPPRRN